MLAGTGTGSFGTAVPYAVGSSLSGGPGGVALGDLNRDGRLDLVSANYNINSVGVLLAQAASGFPATAALFSTGNNTAPNDVAVADVNNDSRPDIVTANFTAGTVGVLLNATVLAAQPALAPAAVTVSPNPAHAAFAVQVPAVAGAPAVQADLRNALGQLVRRKTAPLPAGGTRLTVETSGLAPGVYTLRLQAGGHALAQRVVLY